MQFRQIIGQDEVKRKLTGMVEGERIPHALLLFGPPGTGKRSLAVAMAQMLSCKARQPGDSCGTCSSCIKFSRLVHPDLHFVVPVASNQKAGPKATTGDFMETWREVFLKNPYLSERQWYDAIDAENKQGIINVHESGAVIEKLAFKPYESDYRMMVIWLPERMNQHAANKLLKLIEEPPTNTLIIMVSENTDRILPTILSRTQLVHVPPLPADIIREALLEKQHADPEILEDAVKRANGNFNQALSTLEEDAQEQNYFGMFTGLMRLAYGRKIGEINDWVDDAAAMGRERQKQFMDYCLRMLRENFMLHLDRQELHYMTAAEQDFSSRFSPFIHEGNVYDMAAEFNLAGNHIEANGNPRIVFMDLSIKLIRLLMRKPPEAV